MIEKICVVVADDHDLYRRGLVDFLQTEGIEVLSEAADAHELLTQVEEHGPDVVITDLLMPGDGVKAVKELVAKGNKRVIALSSFENESLLLEAQQAGAMGFLRKNTDNEFVIKGIKKVYGYEEYYCPSLSGMIIRSYKVKRLSCLLFSPHEIEIIRMTCEEKETDEIAKKLFLSVRAVERMRRNIKKIMRVATATGIVTFAIKHGIYVIPKDETGLTDPLSGTEI